MINYISPIHHEQRFIAASTLTLDRCPQNRGNPIQRLKGEERQICWSGRERCYDNILVERPWRTVIHEEVYLRAYSDAWEAEVSLARLLWRYCHVRPHSSLGVKTLHEICNEGKRCSSLSRLTISGSVTVQ
jgi:putative transposase